MDFYRNILFVFPKEKCLPATFFDLQKKSNSSRDSNSVLQILHLGESMLLRYVKFILKFPKFCFYCDNKRQGGDPIPFHCWVGFAFSTCLFNLEICHCPFQANFDRRWAKNNGYFRCGKLYEKKVENGWINYYSMPSKQTFFFFWDGANLNTDQICFEICHCHFL